jgi:hypothetical protein
MLSLSASYEVSRSQLLCCRFLHECDPDALATYCPGDKLPWKAGSLVWAEDFCHCCRLKVLVSSGNPVIPERAKTHLAQNKGMVLRVL